ncbi:hypothetical protein [Propionivibrio sp.]|uniref:hypothetical protein n=1 Tax=Propionivibrio sp. TaxID=2212460 RepID=UPI0039E38CE1
MAAVASVLEAFQTDAFRRVKIGVGKDGAKSRQIDYLLSPFDASDREAVRQSIQAAAAQVLELARTLNCLDRRQQHQNAVKRPEPL